MDSKAILAAVALALAVSAAQADSAKREVQALEGAQVSLTDAIRMAEHEGNGKAIDADYKAASSGVGSYDVKVLSNDGTKLMKYKLDAATGKIESAGNEPFEKVFTRIKAEDISNAPTSLVSAIHMAEQHAPGKALDADVERTGSTVRYDVKVAKTDGTTDKVKIDSSGHLASVK
jgi:uncharacterized membrane protein YkoI